jgi:hypothetical protein
MLDTSDTMKRLVKQFEDATDFSGDDELRITIIEEELAEFREAYANLLKEAADLLYVLAGADGAGVDLPVDLEERATDAVVSMGADILEPVSEAFMRVHRSNMSKLVEGKALRREDGKILKGPNYQPPYLDDLVPGGYQDSTTH